jgi:beta-glucanase (GH16 family)
MNRYEVTGHEPSLLPEGNWELAWSDEFDGTELDRTKWDYRTCMMGKRHKAWTDKGVTLDGNSNAVFTMIEENGMPVSSQLQTGYNFMDEPVVRTTFGCDDLQWPIGKLHENKFTHRFGYYECRCRLQQKEGWWSAFWIQSPTIGASLDSKATGTEIDIMESFEPGKVCPHMLHTGGYGLDTKSVAAREGDLTLDKSVFHRFGVLWDENGYTFYIDGVETGKSSENLSHTPEFILITSEVGGYRGKAHAPGKKAYESIGDTFLVDYVRVFDKVD